MSQLSRPYQIALLAMGLLAAVWFVALRGHSASSESTPAASSQAPASTTPASTTPLGQAEEKAAAAPTPIYHGSAPGVAGLTRAIAKAHEAVAISQHEVKQREQQAAEASSATSNGTGGATVSTQPSSAATRATAHAAPAPRAPSRPARSHAPTAPSMQATVENELKQGKVVTILFWNPKGSDDVAVQHELQAAGRALGGNVVVHEATASQVGSFGTITRAAQVYQTPTILIVNKHGQITTLTGLPDAFSIEQAINEADK